jgi:hypothetical protein
MFGSRSQTVHCSAATSTALSQVINAAGGGGGTNVALASAGAVASASSTYAPASR